MNEWMNEWIWWLFFWSVLKPAHTATIVADFGDNLSPISATICRRKQRLSQKSATVAEFGDCRRCIAVFGDWRRFRRQCGQGYNLSVRPTSSAMTSSHQRLEANKRMPRRHRVEVVATTWILESIIVALQSLLLENTRFRSRPRFLHRPKSIAIVSRQQATGNLPVVT